MFHFLFSDCPQLITSIYILFMQSQGSSLEDMHLHGGITFLHATYAGLDALSPAWHMRRGGEDCQEEERWKGGSLSPPSLPSPCTRTSEISKTRTSEISIHVHAMYKPMHMFIYFVGILARVCTHSCVHIYAQCMCVHTVYI